jgi:hypothetical protein
MQMVLDALEYLATQTRPVYSAEKAIEALRARLAQPEQKPVAWEPQIIRLYSKEGLLEKQLIRRTPDSPIEDYYPQREWQGLTDEEQLEIMKQFGPGQRGLFADAIEAKLKEKNT